MPCCACSAFRILNRSNCLDCGCALTPVPPKLPAEIRMRVIRDNPLMREVLMREAPAAPAAVAVSGRHRLKVRQKG